MVHFQPGTRSGNITDANRTLGACPRNRGQEGFHVGPVNTGQRRRSYRWWPANTIAAVAWFLTTCPEAKYRDGKKGMEYALKACELSHWDDDADYEALAAANADVGHFDEAVKWQEKALSVSSFNKKELARAKERLKLYEEKKPFREPWPNK
jgi:hypothetical protein